VIGKNIHYNTEKLSAPLTYGITIIKHKIMRLWFAEKYFELPSDQGSKLV